MQNTKDLTRGSIPAAISSLALPLIGASFINMTYTMVDLYWLARLGSGPVAAVGAAFFFTWLNTSVSYTTKVGSEIAVSQSIGEGNPGNANKYAQNAYSLAVYMSVAFALLTFIFAPYMMKIFSLGDEIAVHGVDYLRWVTPGLIATFLINTFSSFYYGAGNSHTPFRIISLGLILNMLLDPIFICGVGSFEGYGVKGAAAATVIAQLLVVVMFGVKLFSDRSPVGRLHLWAKTDSHYLRRIAKLGFPAAVQGSIFSFIGMSIASLAGRFGHVGVAAQSIGSQIEAISWNTASGFSTALSSFVGQNYGAKSYSRIRAGYFMTLSIAGSIGFAAGIAFIMFPREIFALFIAEPDALDAGADYLRIMGYSQLMMVIELVTAGAFNGVGRTRIPAYVSITFNALRIPMALLLMNSVLQLSGIWWSITISSCLKGSVLAIWFCMVVLAGLRKEEYSLR